MNFQGVTECSISYCNGGTCNLVNGIPTCSCPPDKTGPTCEISKYKK